jgi:predicted ArsR family transcriptional regulator
MSEPESDIPAADVALDKDRFMRTLIRHLAGTLEEVVGLPEAEGFVSVVGQKIGEEIDTAYRRGLKVHSLSRSQVTAVLVDLKRRIDGDFYVIEDSEDSIVLGNRRCPFGDRVIGRPSMCMMTSNVFGVIVSENLGYARVLLEETIAKGDAGCRVVVRLRRERSEEAHAGREYVRSE